MKAVVVARNGCDPVTHLRHGVLDTSTVILLGRLGTANLPADPIKPPMSAGPGRKRYVRPGLP
jgi:hypothetical protein